MWSKFSLQQFVTLFFVLFPLSLFAQSTSYEILSVYPEEGAETTRFIDIEVTDAAGPQFLIICDALTTPTLQNCNWAQPAPLEHRLGNWLRLPITNNQAQTRAVYFLVASLERLLSRRPFVTQIVQWNYERYSPPANAFYVHPETGNDNNPGTLGEPWRTLQHAFGELSAGDTLLLRGGTYNERGLTLSAQGSENSPILIRNYPGEQVTIDGSLEEFRNPENNNWELVDPQIDLYRSVDSHFGSDVYFGKFKENGEYYNLVGYSNRNTNNGMANISSTIEHVSAGARYVGPGVYNDNGTLYIRLSPHSPTALHGRTYNLPSQRDPRQNQLFLAPADPIISFRGSHIQISGIEIAHGRYGMRVSNGGHHLTVSDVTFTIPGFAVQLDSGSHHITIERSHFEANFQPWLAWTDMKGSDGQSRPADHWAQRASGVNGDSVSDVTVRWNTFYEVFDGSSISGNNLRFHHNTYSVLDDMVQLGSSSNHVEIDHNIIFGAGPSHNGDGSATSPGTKYIHHNVIDTNKEMLWGKHDPQEILRADYSAWNTQVAFPTHTSSQIPDGDPWKIYHNTILFDLAGNWSDGCGIEQWPAWNTTGEPHEFYNNIIVGGNTTLIDDLRITGGGFQLLDGNLYHRTTSNPTRDLWTDLRDSSGTHDFSSLSAFLSSSSFLESRTILPAGWEANGIQADPQLSSSLHPATSSPAAQGAASLPAHLPGPRHTYRGAKVPK